MVCREKNKLKSLTPMNLTVSDQQHISALRDSQVSHRASHGVDSSEPAALVDLKVTASYSHSQYSGTHDNRLFIFLIERDCGVASHNVA